MGRLASSFLSHNFTKRKILSLLTNNPAIAITTATTIPVDCSDGDTPAPAASVGANESFLEEIGAACCLVRNYFRAG